jgi:hypothetical protein
MRNLLKKNYILIRNMIWENHNLFEHYLLLTHNCKTSHVAHEVLEKRIMRLCEKAMTPDYGLQILPDTVLHIANTDEFKFLLQPELKAI